MIFASRNSSSNQDCWAHWMLNQFFMWGKEFKSFKLEIFRRERDHFDFIYYALYILTAHNFFFRLLVCRIFRFPHVFLIPLFAPNHSFRSFFLYSIISSETVDIAVCNLRHSTWISNGDIWEWHAQENRLRVDKSHFHFIFTHLQFLHRQDEKKIHER